MATHTTLAELFADIADAIREKTGDTALIVADNFPAAIRAITTAPSTVTVTITKSGSYTGTSYAYVEIGGTTYTSAATVEVDKGTSMTVYAKNSVTLNGTSVGTSYTMELDGDCEVAMTTSARSSTAAITTA